MPAILTFLFLLAALVCFVLAALGVSVQRINLVAAGLAFWVFPVMFAALDAST